ncbi:hypothetical protein EON66_03150 [archaeon]|nr:MAG: hypothetical protein EON66_03150 [archaeon]
MRRYLTALKFEMPGTEAEGQLVTMNLFEGGMALASAFLQIAVQTVQQLASVTNADIRYILGRVTPLTPPTLNSHPWPTGQISKQAGVNVLAERALPDMQ